MSNPLDSFSDDQLSDAAYSGRQGGIEVEMMRRLKLAIESQTRGIEDFNRKTGRQTTWLLRLTWAIAILTLIMAAGLGWQIYLTLGIRE